MDEVRRRAADACLDILLKVYVGNIDVCCCSPSDQGDEGKEKESIVNRNVMVLTNPDEDSSTSNNNRYGQREANPSLVNSVPYYDMLRRTILGLTLKPSSLIFVCVAGMVV